MQKRQNSCLTLQGIAGIKPWKDGVVAISFLLFVLTLATAQPSNSQNMETKNTQWIEQENDWLFHIYPTANFSYLISENKEKNKIKLALKFSNNIDKSNIDQQILTKKPNFINIACIESDNNYAEYLFTLDSNQTYTITKKDGLFITFTKQNMPIQENSSQEIFQIATDLKSLMINPKDTNVNAPTLDEKLESLDHTISKMRVENELKLAKQIMPTLSIKEPEQVFAQSADAQETGSLSVGNVGGPDKNIEIREAAPADIFQPQQPQSPPSPQPVETGEQSEKETSPTETTEEKKPEEETGTTQETPSEEVPPPMPREEIPPQQGIDATAEITRELRKLETPSKEETSKQLEPMTIKEEQPKEKVAKEEKPNEKISSEEMIKPSPQGLDTIIDFQCEQMPLAKVVPLLAYKANINVIAGADLKGNVTMSLKEVTLRKAIEAALRMNGLGLLQEENIYRIVPYEEAIASDRSTIVVHLENAKAQEIRKVLEEISKGTKGREYITLSANDTTNVVIISGPEEQIQGLAQMARELDIAKPVIPTTTTTIKLNYADPEELVKSLQKILTPKIGNVSADARARNIIITDIPVVVEQVKELVKNLDTPVKQVLIDSMVVDATLGDESQTGIDWVLKSVRNQSWRDFVMYGPEGRKIGNLQQFDIAGTSTMGDTLGNLTFNILTSEIDWKGVIQAEIRNQNGHLISNPVVATIENKPATITISQEIPYIDLSQTSQGGALTNTRFKQIGTVLEVTPRVTHDNHIITDIKGKESTMVGEFNGVPIEDMRQVTSTLHINNGQTIFVGGLRKRNDTATGQKMPILGDIPVLNIIFKTNQRKAQINELLIFLTCSVIEQELPELTDEQKKVYNDAKQAPMDADLSKYMGHDIVHPKEISKPPYQWKRVQKEKQPISK
ncbi:MAG TPA: secretin N-terminal domain-containing protein [Candidatus Hydrogenedens sp.]|nr:secretin N-terminal domain-containing protein [Candidatus Hydrogenedens sp.]